MADDPISLLVRASSTTPEPIQVCLDANSNIVVMSKNGACDAYDIRNGSPLGSCAIPETFLSQLASSDMPPDGMVLSDTWALGDGRWLGWINEHEKGGKDGSAWLYDPNLVRWIKLPRIHHHQMWHAIGLPNRGFASLGLNSNIGSLVVWLPPNIPEILTIPHGPGAKQAGLVELTDGSLLIWPFKDDGSAAILKRSKGSRGFWKIWTLPGSEEIVGAISIPSHSQSPRIITWTRTGEVRLWLTERLSAPLKHVSSGAGKAIRTPHFLNGVLERPK